jgi:hypothetical protein
MVSVSQYLVHYYTETTSFLELLYQLQTQSVCILKKVPQIGNNFCKLGELRET